MLGFYFCQLIALQQRNHIQRLKEYLNMLVVPSPNLPPENNFDIATHEAIKNFKRQINRQRGKSIVEDGSITINLWRFIGQSLVRFDNGIWLTNEYIRL